MRGEKCSDILIDSETFSRAQNLWAAGSASQDDDTELTEECDE